MNHAEAMGLVHQAGQWITRPGWPGYKVGLGAVDGKSTLICVDKVPDQMKWQEVWQPTEEDLEAEDYEVVR